MKKEIKIAIAVVLVLWVFVMGFELGSFNEVRKQADDASATTASTISTTASTLPSTTETTTAPTTVTPTQPSTSTSNENPTEPSAQDSTAPSVSSGDVSSLSKDEVIEKMNTYMAQLKSEQNMSAVMNEVINVTLTDCSVPSATSTINNIVSGIVGDGPESNSYTFTNGQTADGETPHSLIPPCGKDFLLSSAGVVSATAQQQGDSVVYTAVLAAENTTAASPVPTYHSTAIGYLDLMSLDLSGVSITSADLQYPGSTVSITVNSDGKVVYLLNEMPMSGYGAAQIAFISGNATFEGGLNETWEFTY